MTEEQKENPHQHTAKPKNVMSSLIAKYRKVREEKKHTNQRKDESASDTPYFPQSFVSIASVVINAALAVGTFLLWHQASKQSEIAIRSANFADSAVAVAKKSLQLAESNFQIENRAYLDIKEVVPIITSNQVGVGIIIHNAGKTPAYKIITRGEVKNGGTGVYPFEWDSLGKNITEAHVVAGGSGFHTYITDDSPGRNDSTNIVNGIRRLYAFGIITYSDRFGKRHFTRYCLQYNPRVNEFVDYTKYNDSD